MSQTINTINTINTIESIESIESINSINTILNSISPISMINTILEHSYPDECNACLKIQHWFRKHQNSDTDSDDDDDAIVAQCMLLPNEIQWKIQSYLSNPTADIIKANLETFYVCKDCKTLCVTDDHLWFCKKCLYWFMDYEREARACEAVNGMGFIKNNSIGSKRWLTKSPQSFTWKYHVYFQFQDNDSGIEEHDNTIFDDIKEARECFVEYCQDEHHLPNGYTDDDHYEKNLVYMDKFKWFNTDDEDTDMYDNDYDNAECFEYDGEQYLNYTVVQLKAKCKEYGFKRYSTMRKKELLFLLFTAQ